MARWSVKDQMVAPQHPHCSFVRILAQGMSASEEDPLVENCCPGLAGQQLSWLSERTASLRGALHAGRIAPRRTAAVRRGEGLWENLHFLV